jgi:hypothetical protein
LVAKAWQGVEGGMLSYWLSVLRSSNEPTIYLVYTDFVFGQMTAGTGLIRLKRANVMSFPKAVRIMNLFFDLVPLIMPSLIAWRSTNQ